MKNEFLTVQEVAERVGYSQAGIYLAIRRGNLKTYRKGRGYLIKPADFEAWKATLDKFKDVKPYNPPKA